MLSDRIGRRKAMLLGLTILSLGYFLEVTIPLPAVMLASGFLAGAGGALYYNSQAPFMMNASTEETRTLLFSLSNGIITLSGAFGSLVAGRLPQLLSGWTGQDAGGSGVLQIIMLAAVAFGTLSLIPISLIHEDRVNSRAEKEAPEQGNLKDLLRRPVLWKVLMPNLLTGIGAGILMPYINLFYAERFGLADAQLGVLFGLSSLLIGLASLIGPRLAVLLKGRIRTVVMTQGLSFVFLVIMGFTPLSWLSQVAYLVRAMLMNMATPLFSAFGMEQFTPGEQGKASSIFIIGWTTGWAVGPYVSGIVQVHSGFDPLFIATTVLYVTATGLMWYFFGHAEQETGRVPAAREVGIEE
jgi:MFS family permease